MNDGTMTGRSSYRLIVLLLAGWLLPWAPMAQVKDPAAVKALVARYKKESKGPYRDIRWYCPDGTDRPARDPCPVGPGRQRARYRDEVIALGRKEHVFLGQILSTTPYEAFLDSAQAGSRMKQYLLEQYLRRIDDGWVNRRAQYYRGAVQDEDERAWGAGFLAFYLGDGQPLADRFYQARELARGIPHREEHASTWRIRAISRELGDSLPTFLPLRVKIHGSPDAGDIGRVKAYRDQWSRRLPATQARKLDELLVEMEVWYRPWQPDDLVRIAGRLPAESRAARLLEELATGWSGLGKPDERCRRIAGDALRLRREALSGLSPDAALALLDASLVLEDLLLREASSWQAATLGDLRAQVRCYAEAAVAFGYLELWEWDQLRDRLDPPQRGDLEMAHWRELALDARRSLDWSTAMVRAEYRAVTQLFASFEPLANGFPDDRIRSGVLLPLGRAVTRLGDTVARLTGVGNQVMDLSGQSAIRGLNPGYALGELVVVGAGDPLPAFSPDRIYVLRQPPSDLKPVAGILTVTEGNLVSHVQLLARNLGIPNARLDDASLDALRRFRGKRVFLAVSPGGRVLMKAESAMTAEEKALFGSGATRRERKDIPTGRLELADARVLDLRQVDASSSGRVCGPKAANLGQLKRLFPGMVTEGLVIPFAVFRKHMDQRIPGRSVSYWEAMRTVFADAERRRKRGETEASVEKAVLAGLDSLRRHIRAMPLLPEFRRELEEGFSRVLGHPLGSLPVFVRSDTNMEDLKEFTGAGLNLTVFNVRDADKVLQGIRDVWASPYAERSYRWRQRYLTHPEQVYPSILILPSVDAARSGVLVTADPEGGRRDAFTVSFNRGVGGAVDGQAAEVWRLDAEGETLLSPARESSYRALPTTGGTRSVQTGFAQRILSREDLKLLRDLARRLESELPRAMPGGTVGPWDAELGFLGDRPYLFQVRPYAENRSAFSAAYLRNLDAVTGQEGEAGSQTPADAP